MNDCTKCDEGGMIYEEKDGGRYGHSCACGKYARVMEAKFSNLSIADLVNHLEARRIQRGRFLPGERE